MSVSTRARLTTKALLLTSAIVATACGASTAPSTADSTESALVVTPGSSANALTLTSDGGACGDVKSLIEANKDELRGLCGDHELPMPADVSKSGCEVGSVISITFKCVVAKRPPVPANGCRKIEVKDEAHAIPASGNEHVPFLPPLICPMLGGAPPAPPPPPPGGPPPGDGPSAGAPGAGAPSAPPGSAPPPPPPHAPGAPPAPPNGGPGGGCPTPPPVIECCAPPSPPPPQPPGATGAPGAGGSGESSGESAPSPK